VGRLRRAQHLLALLAAALPRERDAIHERRIHEERLPSQLRHQPCTTVMGIARRFGRSAAATAGSGASSTLQQRRQTGKIPCWRRRRRISTYRSPFQISSSDDLVRSPTSTRMNGQKYTLPENDTRAWRNG